jgi:hypothetical protein
LGGIAAIEPVANGSGNGGVADTHLADAQEIGAAGDRLHAIGHGRGTFGFLHGGGLGDVAGRGFERQLEDLEPQIEALADLVHGGTARLEIGHHLAGDGLRIGGDPLLHHAMIAGEHGDDRALDPGGMAPLPARQP